MEEMISAALKRLHGIRVAPTCRIHTNTSYASLHSLLTASNTFVP